MTAQGVSDTAALHVEQLLFRYRAPGTRGEEPGEGARPWALTVSFAVASGEVFGIIGPNGSGKTSLLKLLGKVLRPEAGTIRLFGTDLASLSQTEAAQTVACVPQETQQMFPFTIAETVLMGRFPHHRRTGIGSLLGFDWEGRDDRRLAQQAMEDMDVAHLAARSMFVVSGGERQRVVIARALAQEPRVLLLDEPTAFLDLNHQVDICRILRRLNEERGLTVVLVSHDLNLASQYCDRLMLLDRGEARHIGPPQAVIRSDVLQAVYRCPVLIDAHPISGLPRVTLPGRIERQQTGV